MSETSFTLLQRLQHAPGETAWQRMIDLYTPLIRNWLRRYSLLDQDAEDVIQDVLAVVREDRVVTAAGVRPEAQDFLGVFRVPHPQRAVVAG